MSAILPTRKIWGVPLALALVSAFGLIAALLSDGIGDVLSWAALAAPICVVGWHLSRAV